MPTEIKETILSLPVDCPQDREGWGNRQLFSECAQPFGNIGIKTDSLLHPVDTNQLRLYSNVYIVGRSLAGYDYSHEKSGNGVAIASGYLAGISV
jgi:glycerol-3-phosphate dehydrogenase subunit B